MHRGFCPPSTTSVDSLKSASAQIPRLKGGRLLTIGSFGTFWQRDLVDWQAHSWRLLGRRGLNKGNLRVADFRRARGVYVLYNDINVYYVGLATSQRGIGGRLHDHLNDEHWAGWNRFSWFAFDGPDDDTVLDSDGVVRVVQTYTSVELDAPVLIRDLEALLLAVTKPMGNISSTNFSEAKEWLQVATKTPKLKTFDDLREKLDVD